jgi:hypothetical protein
MARRSWPLVVALSLVIGSPLLGAPRPGTEVQGRAPRRAQTATAADRLGHIWQRLTALWAGEGCAADPNGAKCAITPAGGTAAVVQPPEGCGIDPNGCR